MSKGPKGDWPFHHVAVEMVEHSHSISLRLNTKENAMTPLNPAIEKMIEEIREMPFRDPSNFKARGAREMAEYLTALVCPRCGREPKSGQDCLAFSGSKGKSKYFGFCDDKPPVTLAEFYKIHADHGEEGR